MDFYDRINLVNWCVWLVIKKKSVAMHCNMNIKQDHHKEVISVQAAYSISHLSMWCPAANTIR